MSNRFLRLVASILAVGFIAACGGGGGGGGAPGAPRFGEKGVFSGVLPTFNFDFQAPPGDGSVGGGADGDGGIGAGGALGQFINALVIVRFLDGTELGRATTDPVFGMVTIKPGRDFRGGLIVEIHGQEGAQYFEEGKNTLVPFPPGQVVRTILSTIDKNIGVTPFTDAAFGLALECLKGPVPGVCDQADPGSAAALPSAQTITRANAQVTAIVNQQFPTALQVDDVTRLPFIVGAGTGAGAVPASSQRGRYGLLNVAFSKQAAMYNTADPSPTLLAIRQLTNDLKDGVLDGLNAGAPAAAADKRTYDPATFTTELSSALAQQTSRYGTTDAISVLPQLVGYGAARYDSYYFEARVAPSGATSTVAIATEAETPTRTPGQATPYLPGNAQRAFAVFGNNASGSLFIKTDSADSTSRILAVGDNSYGELGSGNRVGTSRNTPTYTLTLPGVVTHMAGGYGHTLARLADGRVFAWGDNAYGQLGQGSAGGTLPRALAPTAVPLPAGALSVAAGNTSSFALMADGRVFSWGSNWGFGTLGNGSRDQVSPTPGPVLTGAGELTGVVQLSVRDNDGIALRSDGTVWTWGSFPSTTTTGTAPADFVPVANAGGRQVATQVTGLPVTARVRKVMTDQGLFAALVAGGPEDGAVYTWGVHHDITAGGVLVDLVPVRVLNLPPIRDLMIGAYQPYGQRPFDRDTSLGVDYDGKFWRIRGRVAEQYDPANPLAQRRPKGQAPRPDCGTCHTVRGKTIPAMPTTGAACDVNAIPTEIRALLTSQSTCESCHNGEPLSNRAALPLLTCVKPALPAPAAPTVPVALTTVCSLPTTPDHTGYASGSSCATCHNSVIAQPLNCAGAAATFATPLAVTAAIQSITDDANLPVTRGGATNDPSPRLTGSLSVPLAAGQSVQVLRDTALVGTATVSGTGWTFTDAGLTSGRYRYTARVAASGSTAFGPLSAGFPITVDLVSPNQTVTVTSVTDNVGAGAFVGTFTASPVTTDDSTPTLGGALASPLGSTETLRVVRNGVTVGTATVNGLSWTFTDTLPGNASYAYQVRVVDAAGNNGQLSNSFTVNLLAGPTATVDIVQVLAPGSIPTGGTTSSATPDLRFSFSRGLLTGERLDLTRQRTGDSAAVTLTVPGAVPGAQSAAFIDSIPGNGTYTYRAKVVNDAGNEQATVSSFVITCSNCISLARSIQGLAIEADVPLPARDLADGATTTDARPLIKGTVSGAGPFTGLSVRVIRSRTGFADVEQTAVLNPTTGAWSLAEPTALPNAAYTYRARVQDTGGNRGPDSAGRAVTVSVLPTFASGMTSFTDNLPPAGGSASVVLASNAETDDTTPTVSGTLSAALATGQTLSFFTVTAGVETALTGSLSVSGTSFAFTPSPALVNASLFNSGGLESTRLGLLRPFTLRAVVSNAAPARNQSVDLGLLLQPICNYVQNAPSSHTSPALPAPVCSSCHVVGGLAPTRGPGFTCRSPQ